MKRNKFIAIGLSVALLGAPINIFAKSFKDVKKDGNVSWAYKYIDELSNKNILNGYEDGTFKPNNPVSFLEVLQIIKTLMNPSEEEMAKARANFMEKANANSIPEWAKDAVCYNLYHNTITTKTLEVANTRGFITNKVFPNRNTVATYIARALRLNKSSDKSNLKYTDIDKISPITLEYLPELVRNNIFSSTGSEGKFNGNLAIRRSEIASISYKTLGYIENNKVNSLFDNIADDLLIEDESPENTLDNKITEIVDETPGVSIINSPKNQPIENNISNANEVNFVGEITEVNVNNGARVLKVKIKNSDSNKIEPDKVITINTYKNHKVGDIVKGSATLGENSLLNIKLK